MVLANPNYATSIVLSQTKARECAYARDRCEAVPFIPTQTTKVCACGRYAMLRCAWLSSMKARGSLA